MSIDEFITLVKQRGLAPRKTGAGWVARCPVCDAADALPEHLSIAPGDRGGIVIHCYRGCEASAVVKALDRTMRDLMPENPGPRTGGSAKSLVRVHDYPDENKVLLFQVCRYDPKSFTQRRPDSNGHWVWGLSAGEYAQRSDGDWYRVNERTPSSAPRQRFPETDRVLYRLPAVTGAIQGHCIVVVEGEKDADNGATKLRLVTTCNPGGAGKWTPKYNEPLRGADVLIIADRDPDEKDGKPHRKGQLHAAAVAGHLAGVARRVRVLELPDRDGHPVKDLSDWIAAGGTREELEAVSKQLAVTGVKYVAIQRQWQEDHGLPREKAEATGVASPGTAVGGPDQQVPRLATVNAADLARMVIPEPRWAVPGLLPEGLAILAGRPKAGKSWFALELALAVASGTLALGRVRCEIGDVLFFALEDSKRRLQDRIERLVVEPPTGLSLTTMAPLVGAGFVEAVVAWLDEHPSARLVIVDTLARIRPPRKRGGDVYAEDVAMLAGIQRMALDRHVCVLALHHVRKGLTADRVDSVSGTAGITGTADVVLVIEHTKRAHEALLAVAGRDVERSESLLSWDLSAGGWTLTTEVPGAREIAALTENRRRILDVLRGQSASLGPKAIAEVMGTPEKVDSIRHLLRKLHREGLVVSAAHGRYEASPLTTHTDHAVHSVHGGRGEGLVPPPTNGSDEPSLPTTHTDHSVHSVHGGGGDGGSRMNGMIGVRVNATDAAAVTDPTNGPVQTSDAAIEHPADPTPIDAHTDDGTNSLPELTPEMVAAAQAATEGRGK